MKKIVVILCLLVLFIAGTFALGINFFINENTDEKEFDYIWTKAICEGNECMDYEITCANGSVLKMRPISGMVVFSDEWTDPRENKENFCE